MDNNTQTTSTRPYLIRAWHEWCSDNRLTPYVTVRVDRTVQVPLEYVKDNEIVLNIGFEATTGLKLGNEYLEFKARFGGVPRDIWVPVGNVMAIFARETSQGMAFPMTESESSGSNGPEEVVVPSTEAPHLAAVESLSSDANIENPNSLAHPVKQSTRPTLTRIK